MSQSMKNGEKLSIKGKKKNTKIVNLSISVGKIIYIINKYILTKI